MEQFKETAAAQTPFAEAGSGAAEGVAVGRDQVRKAREILSRYKAAKSRLEARVRENEQWFRLRHWEQLREKEEKRSSAWLFNSILNKHADFMDAMPACTVLPREESDTKAAEALTAVLPAILERCRFQSVYSDASFRKLKTGTAVYSVLWDADAADGLGDIAVSETDILHLFWEPGVRDIQKSRHLFYAEAIDNDVLTETYPFLEGRLTGGAGNEVNAYLYDPSVSSAEKSTVIDWYYKKRVNGKTVLHYCKFVNDIVLYASENDEALRERGWYDHGLYPFVFDPLFREEDTPVGFGLIDVMKDTQEEIDIIGNEIVKNARFGSRRRYFTRNEGTINEAEFADFSKDFVHVSGSSLGEDSIREIDMKPLPSIYLAVLQNKITELKETSGNRDFSTGGTVGGVTSGVAITALQEAANKLSRDMIAATYRAFSEVCGLAVELIRQFYTVPRSLRILAPNGEWEFALYDNRDLLPAPAELEFGVDFGQRAPHFDLSVQAHKLNAFSRAAQNQDAVNFFNMGFFDPARSVESLACLQLIDIDNKEKLTRVIEENGRRYGALQPEENAPAAGGADPAIRQILQARQASGLGEAVSP